MAVERSFPLSTIHQGDSGALGKKLVCLTNGHLATSRTEVALAFQLYNNQRIVNELPIAYSTGLCNSGRSWNNGNKITIWN